jgi:hypothetical protein
MPEPCIQIEKITRHEILIKKIDDLMTDNGHDGLPTIVTRLDQKVDTFNNNIETIFGILKDLSAFMEGEKAVKARNHVIMTWGLGLLGITVTGLGLWLSNTKTSIPQVKAAILEQKIEDSKKKIKDTEHAFFQNEVKSQLKKDTLK